MCRPSGSNERPSDAAKKAMVAELTAVANAWALANPEALDEGARSRFESDVSIAEEQILEHLEAIKVLRQKIRDLEVTESKRAKFGVPA